MDVEVKIATRPRALRRVNVGAVYARLSKWAGVNGTRRNPPRTVSPTSLN